MKRHVSRYHINVKVKYESGDYKTVCDYCNELIPRRNLQRHFYQMHRKETGMDLPENQVTLEDLGKERAYRCSQCEFECDIIPDLDRHIARVHTKKDYMDCKICGKSISVRCMDGHIKLVHQSRNKFTCEYCNMQFGTITWYKHA